METGTLRSETDDFNRAEDAALCLELVRSPEAAYSGCKDRGETIGSWGDEFLFLLEQMKEGDRPSLEQIYMVTSKILLTQAHFGRAPLGRRALQNPEAFLGSILQALHYVPIDL